MSEVSFAATLCKVVLQNLASLELNPSLHLHAWLQPLWTGSVVGWGLPWNKPWQWHLVAKASRIPCHVSVLSVVSVGSWQEDPNQALWLGRSLGFPGNGPSFEGRLAGHPAEIGTNQIWIRTTTESYIYEIISTALQHVSMLPFSLGASTSHASASNLAGCKWKLYRWVAQSFTVGSSSPNHLTKRVGSHGRIPTTNYSEYDPRQNSPPRWTKLRMYGFTFDTVLHSVTHLSCNRPHHLLHVHPFETELTTTLFPLCFDARIVNVDDIVGAIHLQNHAPFACNIDHM